MISLKQIKKEVEKQGLNFEEWRKNSIDKKMLALISKEKEYYSVWELRELNDSLFELLINNTNKKISINKSDSKNFQQINKAENPIKNK